MAKKTAAAAVKAEPTKRRLEMDVKMLHEAAVEGCVGGGGPDLAALYSAARDRLKALIREKFAVQK